MVETVIVDAVRTPMGKRGGVFRDTRADELAAHCLSALAERNNLDPTLIDDVVMGCVTQLGEQGLNISRISALVAGWPVTVPGVVLNRMCGSGQQAVTFAAQEIMSGMADVTIGCGTENMTRTTMGSDSGPLNTKLTDRFNIIPQGNSAELMAERWELSRDELDDFGYESHVKARKATEEGKFKDELVPFRLNGHVQDVDETIRFNADRDKLGNLKPAFQQPDGKITAGNSSQITDGAAAVLLMSAAKAKELGLKPLARIVHTAIAGVDPTIMLSAPIPATQKALAKSGLKLDEMEVIEINEAFASVPLATIKELGMAPEKVNPLGGACALGHPLGATGARLIGTLAYELRRRNARYGLSTLCIGFGQGIATIIENVQ